MSSPEDEVAKRLDADLRRMLVDYRREHPIRSFFAPKWRQLRMVWWHVHNQPKWTWQKLTRRYTDPEVWNFNYFLGRLIRDGTQWYLDHGGGTGYPADLTHEQWMQDLRDINEFFTVYVRDDVDDWDWLDVNWHSRMELFKERFGSLWD